MKAVLHDGRDISDTLLDPPGGGALSGVEVIVTNRVATLAGQVVNAAGTPIAEGTIVVFADGAQKWYEASRWVQALRPDQRGRFQIASLLPGEYLAVAMDYVEDGMWNDPDYLASLRPFARTVTVSADGPPAEIVLTLVTP
jgi:hypothetical protein